MDEIMEDQAVQQKYGFRDWDAALAAIGHGGLKEGVVANRLKERKSIFARIGKKYIVNLNYVYKINPLKKQLILTDFTNFAYQLEISREALKTLKELMVKMKI